MIDRPVEIAALINYEIQDVHDNLFIVDLFMTKDENGDIAYYIFENLVDADGRCCESIDIDDASDHEQQAWLDDAVWFEVADSNDPLSLSLNQIQDAVSDTIRGAIVPVIVPSLPYMANDENTMTERDWLQYYHFNAVLDARLRGIDV